LTAQIRCKALDRQRYLGLFSIEHDASICAPSILRLHRSNGLFVWGQRDGTRSPIINSIHPRCVLSLPLFAGDYGCWLCRGPQASDNRSVRRSSHSSRMVSKYAGPGGRSAHRPKLAATGLLVRFSRITRCASIVIRMTSPCFNPRRSPHFLG
jgi:hypothetical protein